jgi:hypothetical protein
MREIAENAEKVLETEGWWKGTEPRTDVPCLGLALSKVVKSEHQVTISRQVNLIIRSLFPDRDRNSIPFFNDHPDTTREDISLVLKHLAAKA